MAENTFTREITFISTTFDTVSLKSVTEPITKTATFNDLSRTNKAQHKLHFMLISLFSSSADGETMQVDSDKLYDITAKAVKTLLIVETPQPGVDVVGFTEQDKTEFLNDSGALFSFGFWLLKEKLTPFFANLMTK